MHSIKQITWLRQWHDQTETYTVCDAAVTHKLAPFAEQHRIVAKIEELFSELDKASKT